MSRVSSLNQVSSDHFPKSISAFFFQTAFILHGVLLLALSLQTDPLHLRDVPPTTTFHPCRISLTVLSNPFLDVSLRLSLCLMSCLDTASFRRCVSKAHRVYTVVQCLVLFYVLLLPLPFRYSSPHLNLEEDPAFGSQLPKK
jgi:hypothetical protein